jgi:hypothetical protein
MDLPPDLTDLLAELESSGVEYLVIGGWAVATYAKPRFTGWPLKGRTALRLTRTDPAFMFSCRMTA